MANTILDGNDRRIDVDKNSELRHDLFNQNAQRRVQTGLERGLYDIAHITI